MFEKDAEEKSLEQPFSKDHYYYGFKDGAEFGYNKALEEIGDLRDCCNCKYWHYSTRSLSYYCDKTDKTADYERQGYRCEHWER